MSLPPLNAMPQPESDDQADALKDQLRKDVASWREGRADGSSRQSTELSVAVAKPAPAPRARRVKAVATEVPATSTKKKPFGMSYDGSTPADYISYRISRGAR